MRQNKKRKGIAKEQIGKESQVFIGKRIWISQQILIVPLLVVTYGLSLVSPQSFSPIFPLQEISPN